MTVRDGFFKPFKERKWWELKNSLNTLPGNGLRALHSQGWADPSELKARRSRFACRVTRVSSFMKAKSRAAKSRTERRIPS
jgi:hypothetical protein